MMTPEGKGSNQSKHGGIESAVGGLNEALEGVVSAKNAL